MNKKKARVSSNPSEDTRPRVYVYGGGVAGMTAAHELAIRGFAVHLYERERALGPRGVLEDPSLGGMARTQYFATAPEQELYFHVDPVKRLMGRLRSQDERKLIAQLREKRTQKRLTRFFDGFWELLLKKSRDDAPWRLLNVLVSVLEDEHLRAFVRALLVNDPKGPQKPEGMQDTQDTQDTQIRALLSVETLELKTLVGGIREYLRFLHAEASDRAEARRKLAEVFTWALLNALPQGSQVSFLKKLAVHIGKTGPLPEPLGKRFQDLLKQLLPSLDPLAFFYSSSIKEEPTGAEGPTGAEKSLGFMRGAAPLFPRMAGVLPGQGPEAANYFPEYWVEFKFAYETPNGPVLAIDPESERGLERLLQYVNELARNGYFDTELGDPSEVKVLVQAFVDPGLAELGDKPAVSGLTDRAREKARSLADLVVEFLEKRLEKPLCDQVELYGSRGGGFLKAYAALGLAPVARDWVRVIFYRAQLPGEHGYRFFPSYYRHVFDTMRRIPLQDASGQPVGGTVLDNLVPLPQIGIFSKQSSPFIMSWNSIQPGEALSRADYSRRKFADLNIHSQDLLQFSARVLRYMTACPQRRAFEMEDLSWWDYLEGYDARTGTRLYRYSDAFKDLVRSSSRVLAALDGAHGDARTCGNTYVQLLTQVLVPTAWNNCTLNGPTSEAWFFHWRKHLEQLDVQFHHGELQRFVEKDGRLIARVRCFPKKSEDTQQVVHGGADERVPVYFVVATDLVSAARVAEKGLNVDMATRLRNYAFTAPQRGADKPVERDPEEVSSRSPWDRLQTISGIQYFFQKHVNVFDGYIYCVDAEWGLSAICSHLVWKERPVAALSAYQSILSVDIGDWETKSKRLGKSARECSPEELKEEVLHQLRVSLCARGEGRGPAGFGLPEPDFVHIDEGLEYESLQRKAEPRRLRRNKLPYLVPIVGDWRNRPGPEPWDPAPEASRPPYWAHGESTWQALHGGYPVHHGRLVFAGTYLKTFTRMTTMESANESARHAVNAILDHYSVHHAQSPRMQDFWRSSESTGSAGANPYERGFFPTTPQGDYCRIWNPETHELPDFELLQRQDEENFRQKRPHPLDGLGLELMPSLLTQVPHMGDAHDHLIKWMSSRGTAVPEATQGVLALLRHLRSVLEAARPPRGY